MDSKNLVSGIQIIATQDGSHTLYSTQFRAHYHSTHGALQESQHVFLQEGLVHYLNTHTTCSQVNILEVGMGTGLNVWLTALHDFSSIQLHTIEAYPIEENIAKQLNYPRNPNEKVLFDKIHSCAWGEWNQIREGFDLKKEILFIEDFESSLSYDIVYFDAFAPSAQKHLWQEETLLRIVKHIKPSGILVTFCAQGAFKRILKQLGMSIERVPGPPGKREMTRAIKL